MHTQTLWWNGAVSLFQPSLPVFFFLPLVPVRVIAVPYDDSRGVNHWFSQLLGVPCSLVRKHPHTHRHRHSSVQPLQRSSLQSQLQSDAHSKTNLSPTLDAPQVDPQPHAAKCSVRRSAGCRHTAVPTRTPIRTSPLTGGKRESGNGSNTGSSGDSQGLGFANESALLLISTASLADLEARIEGGAHGQG